MKIVSPETMAQMESQHMGITVQIEFYEMMVLPTCPNCGSKETATVNVGITGRTSSLAAATSKFHLRGNGRSGDYYCNICQGYFSDHGEIKRSPGECSPIPKYGKLYYDTGELKYEGYFRESGRNRHEPYGHGIRFYRTGTVMRAGLFGGRGLRVGQEYYPSGQLRFEGRYDTIENSHWFPVNGRYYLEDGTLAYDGEFKIERDGFGYLKIIEPADYGPVTIGKNPTDIPSIQYGKLYYDTGELRYEGHFERFLYDENTHRMRGKGRLYYINGGIYKEGIFGIGGLLRGRIYYPSGQLKFEGEFNSKKGMSYYGPTYPVQGKFWLEDGSLAYQGKFEVVRQGNVGYPKVVFPENFGFLD